MFEAAKRAVIVVFSKPQDRISRESLICILQNIKDYCGIPIL